MIRKAIAAVIAAGIMAVGFASPASAATLTRPAHRHGYIGRTAPFVIVPLPVARGYIAKGYTCKRLGSSLWWFRCVGPVRFTLPTNVHPAPMMPRTPRPIPMPGLPRR